MESNKPSELPYDHEHQEGGDDNLFGFTTEDILIFWTNNEEKILLVLFSTLVFMFVFLLVVSKRKVIKKTCSNIFSGMLESDTSEQLDLRVNLDHTRNNTTSNRNNNTQTRNISAAAHSSVHRPVYLPSFDETGDEEDHDKYFVKGFEQVEIIEDKDD